MKIRATIVTTIEFDTVTDFKNYLRSPECAQITGFREEFQKAFETKRKCVVSTERPKVGAITKSEMLVEEIEVL